MREINIGLVGFGAMGRAHTFAYRTLPFYYQDLPFRANLAGVCSGHLANAEKAKADFGYDFATDDYNSLLADERIDIIDICTPNNLHYDMVMKAIAAGKHIYCDKPLTVTSEQADEIARTIAGTGLINQMAFNTRFLPAVLRAKQLVDEGRIGKVLSFRTSYLHAGSVDPNKPIGWKLNQDVSGGGVLYDLGSHMLDLIYHLLGEYKSIYSKNVVAYPFRPDSSGNPIRILAEDLSIMIVEMKNGGTGIIEASKIATGTNDELRFEIHGDKGAIRFNLMDPNWLEFYDNTLPEQPLGGERGFKKIECVQRYEKPGGGFPAPKSSISWIRGHVHSIYRFLDCVDQNQPACPSFADGAYVQRIMANAAESNRSGQPVIC